MLVCQLRERVVGLLPLLVGGDGSEALLRDDDRKVHLPLVAEAEQLAVPFA